MGSINAMDKSFSICRKYGGFYRRGGRGGGLKLGFGTSVSVAILTIIPVKGPQSIMHKALLIPTLQPLGDRFASMKS